MLERKHLAIIVALKRFGSLTAAAEALYLSQSALSHSIGRLEAALGISLWQKQGRGLRLTRAGERLYQQAQKILPQFAQLEDELRHFASGRRGLLRLGMECHPCYRWLLTVVEPYLAAWPLVDMDLKQQFQFKGAEALLHYEIDLLITPDPVERQGLLFRPVFPYEQVLVVAPGHRLAERRRIEPADLAGEVLLTYPVPPERLDIFSAFLWPAGVEVGAHKTVEMTEIMLQMVAARRGVTALPLWLVQGYGPLRALRLGNGLFKQIHLGLRQEEETIDYIAGFIQQALLSSPGGPTFLSDSLFPNP